MKHSKEIQQGQGTAMRNREHIVRIFWFEGMSRNAGGDNESWPKVIFFHFFNKKKTQKTWNASTCHNGVT